MGMFDSAPVKNPVTKRPTKAESHEVVALDGWAVFAGGMSIIKALEGFLKPMGTMFKETCLKIAIAKSKGFKPESFNLLDGPGEGQFQIRKKGSNIPLSRDEVIKLNAFHVPLLTVETQPEHFFINPEVLANPIKRAAIEEALLDVPELQGDTIIFRQEPLSKTVVGPDSIKAAFGLKDPREIALCLSMLTTLAFKTGFTGTPTEAMALLESVGFTFAKEEEEAEAE